MDGAWSNGNSFLTDSGWAIVTGRPCQLMPWQFQGIRVWQDRVRGV